MTDQQIKRLAEAIAADLFTNGSGDHADRLVMIDGAGRNLGGWSERAMANRIAKMLREAGKGKR